MFSITQKNPYNQKAVRFVIKMILGKQVVLIKLDWKNNSKEF